MTVDPADDDYCRAAFDVVAREGASRTTISSPSTARPSGSSGEAVVP
jgi:hypothetical protein